MSHVKLLNKLGQQYADYAQENFSKEIFQHKVMEEDDEFDEGVRVKKVYSDLFSMPDDNAQITTLFYRPMYQIMAELAEEAHKHYANLAKFQYHKIRYENRTMPSDEGLIVGRFYTDCSSYD